MNEHSNKSNNEEIFDNTETNNFYNYENKISNKEVEKLNED